MSLIVDRKALHSQYNRKNLQIHYQLVSLYATNLNSIATISALIARLSFGEIQGLDLLPSAPLRTLDYLYSLISIFALLTALLSLTQTTLCLLFHPIMFLFGETRVDPITALCEMREKQHEGFIWCCTSVGFALLQALVFSWSITSFPLSCILTMVHLGGYALIYLTGKQTINELTPVVATPSVRSTSERRSPIDFNRWFDQQPTLRELISRTITGSPGRPQDEIIDSCYDSNISTTEMKNIFKVEEINSVRVLLSPLSSLFL
jgi:hypothetical protein